MTLPQIDLWYGFSPDSKDGDGGPWLPDRVDQGHTEIRPTLVPEDAELVAALRGEDTEEAQAAFDWLYRTHAVAIARFAYGYLRSQSSAEDVVADVFLAIWTRRHTWNPGHGIRAYLYVSARHRALNILRSQGRHTRRVQSAAREIEINAHEGIIGAGDEEASLQARLDAAMAALPEESRRLAELRWREGMSPVEIATVLGIDRSAVDNRLSRLVKRLRTMTSE